MSISRRGLRRFVPLHAHSTFSYGDGFGTVADHVGRIAELGGPALALTEHGNVSSWVQLEKAAVKAGIKPIFGLEGYAAPPGERRKFHQTILAETPEGLRNLNVLVGRSWAEGFYHWPTIHGQMMADNHEGLIMTSGCADSLLSCTLLGGKSLGDKRDRASSWDMDNAERVVRRFRSLLGDGYYLEVQRFPGLDRTKVLNSAFAELSRRTGVPLVATADVHYPHGHQNEMQKILHAAHRGGTVESAEASWEYDILLTYPTSDAEIYHDLIATGLTPSEAWAAVLATEEIANRCNVVLPKNESLRFPVPDGWSAHDLLWEWLREGWRYRFPDNPRMQANPDEYTRRLHYEMGLIESKDYDDYFLMVADAVRYAKDLRPRPIPVGPARGSAAASLVCYLSRITEVDPLQFPSMVFERFIDVSRTDLPDIDLDFADTRRDEVRAYLVGKYGADRVANIGTFTKYKGRNSIKDVARVYPARSPGGIPKHIEELVKGVVLDRSGGDSRADESLADAIEMFDFAKAAVAAYPNLRYAIDLEGNQRGMGIHAAGIVISNRPIADTCAMYTRETNGETRTVLAYDKKDAEYVGMLKMDFLGLSTMGMIDLVLDMIGMDLADLYRVPLDESRTLDAFRRGDVVGIFQFEGRATRLVNNGVVPDHFMHLADINALARPGPLFSGMTAAYMEVKHGRKEPDHLHPLVWKYTEGTYGQIIYQEQVLQIVREIGGFPVERVGDIRRIISQKLGEASMHTMFEDFKAGALRLHGIDEGLATRIWKFMVTSATYSFNVAHCVSYSMLGFWCMWLKVNYPREFYTAQLQKVGDDKQAREMKRPRLLNDAVKNGFHILPPDPVKSGRTWQPDPDDARGIRAGFMQVPGIAAKTAGAILRYREEFGVEEWADLEAVRGIGTKTIDKMMDFVEDEDPFKILLTAKVLDEIRNGIARRYRDYRGLPAPTHVSHEIPKDKDCNVTWLGVVRSIEYKDLIEDERARTGDSVEEILARTKDPHLLKSVTLRCYDDGDDDVYCKINRWSFPKFKALVEKIVPGEDVVIVAGRKRSGFGLTLQVRALVHMDMGTDEEDDEDAV